jgi:hypothetical protein
MYAQDQKIKKQNKIGGQLKSANVVFNVKEETTYVPCLVWVEYLIGLSQYAKNHSGGVVPRKYLKWIKPWRGTDTDKIMRFNLSIEFLIGWTLTIDESRVGIMPAKCQYSIKQYSLTPNYQRGWKVLVRDVIMFLLIFQV